MASQAGSPCAKSPSVTVVRSGTTVTGELVDLAATEEGVGTLWLTPEGRLRLYVTAERAEMDLGAPAFDAGDELVQSPALFACAERLIVTWRRAADTAGNGTRAVLVDPATGAASTSFAWPLATADGPAAYGPLDHGVDYTQVGPCQGRGCAQNWLSTGTIELSF